MKRAAALLAACASLGAAAQPPAVHWYTQVDNDVFYGTDRWYTSGLRVARLEALDARPCLAASVRRAAQMLAQFARLDFDRAALLRQHDGPGAQAASAAAA